MTSLLHRIKANPILGSCKISLHLGDPCTEGTLLVWVSHERIDVVPRSLAVPRTCWPCVDMAALPAPPICAYRALSWGCSLPAAAQSGSCRCYRSLPKHHLL